MNSACGPHDRISAIIREITGEQHHPIAAAGLDAPPGARAHYHGATPQALTAAMRLLQLKATGTSKPAPAQTVRFELYSGRPANLHWMRRSGGADAGEERLDFAAQFLGLPR